MWYIHHTLHHEQFCMLYFLSFSSYLIHPYPSAQLFCSPHLPLLRLSAHLSCWCHLFYLLSLFYPPCLPHASRLQETSPPTGDKTVTFFLLCNGTNNVLQFTVSIHKFNICLHVCVCCLCDGCVCSTSIFCCVCVANTPVCSSIISHHVYQHLNVYYNTFVSPACGNVIVMCLNCCARAGVYPCNYL